MKGLLYKDSVILWKQGKMYLLITLIFSLVPQLTRAGFAMAYAAIMPYSVIAYDEQSKWNRLAIMMPYTDRHLVLSKYALSWLCMLVVMVLSAVSRTADCLVNGEMFRLVTEYQEVVIFTAASSLFAAIVLPLVFRYGVERGRLAFIPVIVIGTISVVVAGERIAPLLSRVSLWGAVGIALALAVAANAASVLISRQVFRKGLQS